MPIDFVIQTRLKILWQGVNWLLFVELIADSISIGKDNLTLG
jgi:hypothetical protein